MKDYRDIFGWFPEESADVLGKLIDEYKIKTITEIGSFLGKSTVFFASKGMNVVAIDPFVFWQDIDRPNGDVLLHGGEDFYDKFCKNIKGYESQILALRGTSKEFAEENLLPAHLIYIDGLHDYESVKQDIALWDNKAIKIICGDDYDENWPGVKKAVDEYYGDRVKSNGRIWYVIK